MGVNGFGRIGRLVVRAALSNPSVEVVAINDRRITEVKHVKQALSGCAGQNVEVLTAREGGLRRCSVTALAAADHQKVEVTGKGNTLWRRITASRQQDA